MSTTTKPTPAALRAADRLMERWSVRDDAWGHRRDSGALAIDHETGLPELLEALESMRCTLCDELIGTSFPPSWWCYECKAARAALAKARG